MRVVPRLCGPLNTTVGRAAAPPVDRPGRATAALVVHPTQHVNAVDGLVGGAGHDDLLRVGAVAWLGLGLGLGLGFG